MTSFIFLFKQLCKQVLKFDRNTPKMHCWTIGTNTDPNLLNFVLYSSLFKNVLAVLTQEIYVWQDTSFKL